MRAAQLDATVFQSPGSQKADPAARRAARGRYGGFWGPWQADAEFECLPEGSMVGWSQEECADCQ